VLIIGAYILNCRRVNM